MNETKIYEDYTNVLMELNELESQYRGTVMNADASTKEALLEKIADCRKKLSAITEQMIHDNPFIKGKQPGHKALSE